MYPHRIRLRGPWECEPLARLARRADGTIEKLDQPLPPKIKVTMPCRWGEAGLGDFTGRVRFIRHFGLPRQIDPHERVWLTFAGAHEFAQVWLNERFLGRYPSPLPLSPAAGERGGGEGDEAFELDVTSLLQERNQLMIEVESYSALGGLGGEVALEVRRTAYLQGMRLWATYAGQTAQLHVAGAVAGTSEQSLEVYVILNGSTIAYTTVAAGGPFHLVSEELPPECWQATGEGLPEPHQVRIDLVEGASLWYTVELRFAFQQGDE
jgi:hypothetical protein